MQLPPPSQSLLVHGPLINIDVTCTASSATSSSSLSAAACSLGPFVHASLLCNNAQTRSFSVRVVFKHVRGLITAASLGAPIKLRVATGDVVELGLGNFPLVLSLEQLEGGVCVNARVAVI